MWLRDILDTFRTLRLADVLDITVMAALLYCVLLWFKQTKAAFVARGIFIFAMVYAIAQQAGMYLTTWMFQGFFAIFVIALVVIFQEELRSFFERLALWSLRRSPHALETNTEVEIVVRAAGELARGRIGALIIVRGRDPLERHIDGGEDLDGRLSGPLLMSLFDPHSVGHDGAVVIEGSQVVQFGAHLPLSKEFEQLSGVGTRHAAALGLSERTDALCLVVSEERGVISLARDGTIVSVTNLGTLEDQLTAFLEEKAPLQGKTSWWRDALRRHAAEKVSALVISLVLWLVFVQGFSPSSTVFQVPVEVRTHPEKLHVAAVHPAKVKVTLKGLKRDLRLLNPLGLKVWVDLEGAEVGTTAVVVSEENLRIPGPLQLDDLDPSVVEFEVIKPPKRSTRNRPFLGRVIPEAPEPPADTPPDHLADAPPDE